MTEANGRTDAVLQEIGYLDVDYIEDTEEEQIEKDAGDIPPSLLSYFETSHSRAAVCHRLLQEEAAEDGTSPCLEQEKHMSFGLEIPLDETKLKKSNEGKQEKHQCVEMTNGNQKTELGFQKELREIMETEELHQKELELREKMVQEKPEQEFLLQQEVINNLQRRVQEEGRKSEEEQKRMKDEEDGRRREERKRDLEEERERMVKDRIEKMNLQLMQKEIKRKEQEERRKRREEEMIKNEERRVEVIKLEGEKRKNGERTENINVKRVDEESKVKREEERVEMLRAKPMDEELPEWLPEPTELKRLSWMKDCPSWTKLSLLNKRKPGPSVRGHRRPQRAAGAPRLPPLSPQSLLQPTGVGSLKEVTAVTLEDLPGCSLSTVALCSQLQLLSLRRCGLTSLDGINQLQKLSYVDVQENDISFVDCNNMKSLRVLHLSHNKLTSIHGLAGTENLDVLNLSHNSITRISGLESMKRLQKLSLDHNELISTAGLSDTYTLLHLSCSHNHLTSVEGLENNALLHTLDLSANSLAEPPRLSNQVLLRELHLDDNSISSLQALAACWLPLMQRLSVAQNRIPDLPSMSDYVSLEQLDLQLNCISELQNVCASLKGCLSLREVHLTGNPLQQERSWRSRLLRAVPGLRVVDEPVTVRSSAERPRLAPGSFLSVCHAQLQQTSELQQRHSQELRQAASSLDAAKISCRHLHEASQLAVEQRFTHEYDDTETEKHWGRNRVKYGTFDQNSAESCIQDRLQPAASMVNPGSTQAAGKKENMIPSNADIPPVTNLQDQTLQSAAALVIQQRWRSCRLKCGSARIRSPRSDGEHGTKSRAATLDRAATVIQAFWRGFSLRRRLKAALATVPVSDSEEDDFFEDDVLEELDQFFFEQWEMLSGGDVRPLPRQQKSFPESSRLSAAPFPGRSREGWRDAEQVDADELRVSPVRSAKDFRSESPCTDVNSLSSEEVMEQWGFSHSGTALLMLKRAQKMKSNNLQHKEEPRVQVGLADANFPTTRNRGTERGRNPGRVGKAEPGRKERAQQRLHARTLLWGPGSEGVWPDIQGESPNGGRAPLPADQGHHNIHTKPADRRPSAVQPSGPRNTAAVLPETLCVVQDKRARRPKRSHRRRQKRSARRSETTPSV
ncbi:leucine-rich repeat and IQ domain-containing protein 1 isoform X2 [Takifugu flavidus]|uniref:leucine-rich repeat and IQ domain-containing protein 1 isoform X2 n=1 Tax=Takifugu flavidus TaxID=433684 RepID=UPI0025447A81|nr:leucine-rich repeat and IQ domain-containing protein 1 isoform X2 [Takifugu flavidus]